MTDDDRPATLEVAVRDELIQLWHDLYQARRDAIRTDWSIQCENVADRIVELSRFVGATSWENIQCELLRSGFYERVLNDAGITYEPIDWERVAITEASIAGRKDRSRQPG